MQETTQSELTELRVELTKVCNGNCSYCYLAGTPRSEASILDERTVKCSIEEAAHLGLRTVSFTGGEPLLRAVYLSQLVRWSRSLGLEPGVLTNATLVDEDSANRLAEAGLTWARISFDAPPENEDVAWAHCRSAMHLPQAIALLRSRRISVILRATVSSYNAHCLGDLARFAAETRVAQLELQPYFPIGSPRVDRRFLMSAGQHVATAGDALRLRQQLESELELVLYSGWFEFLSPEYRGQPVRPSRCGRQFLFLDSSGWLKTCAPSRRLLSMVGEGSGALTRCWLNDGYLGEIRNLTPSGICADCEWFATCRRWCPAPNTVYGLPPNHPIPTCPKAMGWTHAGPVRQSAQREAI